MEASTNVDTVGFAGAATSGESAEAADSPSALPGAVAVTSRDEATAGGGASSAAANWPPEVELILSAMDVGRDGADASAHADAVRDRAQPSIDSAQNRRKPGRRDYRVRAHLQLFSDRPGTEPWTLYTRDVGPRSLGFITPHRLPLGYGGWVEIPTPRSGTQKIHCTLFRCRPAVQGWFEGALSFNREQHVFE
jgi:hypothetical protein